MSDHYKFIFMDIASGTNQIGESLNYSYTLCIGHMIDTQKEEQSCKQVDCPHG